MTDGRPVRPPAIYLGSGASLDASSVSIAGFGTGVYAEPGARIRGRNFQFQDVDKHFDLQGVSSADISGTRTRTTRPHGRSDRTFKGWTNSHGAPLPSYCEQCDHVFLSTKYEMSGLDVTLSDNEDICPECGEANAKLSEGHFDLMRQAVKILAAPERTRQMVKRIAAILTDASNGTIPLEEAIKRIEEVSPALAPVLRSMLFWGAFGYNMLFGILGNVDTALSLYDRYNTKDQQVVEQQVLTRSLKACQKAQAKQEMATPKEQPSHDFLEGMHEKKIAAPAAAEAKKAKHHQKGSHKAKPKANHKYKQNRSQMGKSRTW